MTPSTLHERLARLPADARAKLAAAVGLGAPASAPATLVAYYVSASGTDVPVEELRRFLGSALPSHLVPALFHRIAQVPRTLHGKVDTQALPDPVVEAPADTPHAGNAPSDIEEQLLTIWKSVLGIKRISRHDSFFELGGDSLLAIRLLGQIRDRWNIDLSMADLFDAPTVAGAAAQIEAVLWARSTGNTGSTAKGTQVVEEF